MSDRFIYYLAYGSNMAEARLRRRIPSAKRLCVIPLIGHRFSFDNVSTKDGSGKCAALVTNLAEDRLLAVLYRIAADDKPILDGYEGVGVEYRDAFIPVTLPDGQPTEALIYYPTNLSPGVRPYHWYKEHVVRGALENDLPDSYIAAIRAAVSMDDSQPEREALELSIYR